MNFSVIIPTLNEKMFLGPCIDDIQRLDTGVEIIVADGGSTDSTDLIASSKGTSRRKNASYARICKRNWYLNLPGGAEQWTSP
jgi:glycosyltransferase involved in cell wall biosynthesis